MGRIVPPPASNEDMSQAEAVQVDAHAFWLREPGCGEIRPVALPEPGRGDVMVRTLRSGISRGTETLVFRGGVPASQYDAMRAPFQEGDFPGPVKYGYLSVGAVEEGPAELRGRTVFCLYPHQTAYVVPSSAVSVVPEDVPPARAVLAGTVEAAVNALWDAAPLVGVRVTVVGAGRVGCCVARLLSRIPAVQVGLVDVDAGRAVVAAALGADFALPAGAQDGRDLVVHTSATAAGSPSGRASWAPYPRPAAPAARPPTGWRSRSTCCATPPSTCSLPSNRASRSCPPSWPGWPQGACLRSATPSPTARGRPCTA